MTNRNLHIIPKMPMLLIAVAAVSLIMTACHGHEDEPEMPQQQAIAFGGEVETASEVKHAPQAVTEDAGASHTVPFSTFEVWGYKSMNESGDTYYQTVFEGYYVSYTSGSAGTTTTNTNDWDYVGSADANFLQQSIKYWDFSAKCYRFFAQTPFKGNTVGGYSRRQATFLNEDGDTTTYIQEAASAQISLDITGEDDDALKYYSDLCLKTNGGLDGNGLNSLVTLTFHRPTCRVRYKFIYPEGFTASNFAITNMRFIPVADQSKDTTTDIVGSLQKGTIYIRYDMVGTTTTPTITYPTEKTKDQYAIIYDPYEEEAVHVTTAKKWYTLMPVGEQGAYCLEAFINGAAKTATVPAAYMNWKPDGDYTYIFKVTETSIAFDHAVEVYTKWQAGYSTNVDW